MAILLIFIFINVLVNPSVEDESIIKKKLFNQAECWNNGDIDCFMHDYWKDEKLMYIGKKGVTYGWHNTLENYKLKYPTQKEMGQLMFQLIELRKINTSHYFMVGKWQLNREIGNIEGHFSLIWKKINNEWVIITDHSS